MLSMEVSALLLLLEVLGYFTMFSVDATNMQWAQLFTFIEGQIYVKTQVEVLHLKQAP